MKRETLRIGLAQINCTVGDLDGNLRKIWEYVAQAQKSGVDIVVFPELALTGYPPEDLLLKPKFVEDNLLKLRELARGVGDIAVICGFVDRKGNNLYNAAGVIYSGKVKGAYRKALLPNYSVFDEKRYFQAGDNPLVFSYGKVIFGINICEDIWHSAGPIQQEVKAGAVLIININASPYYSGKAQIRRQIISGQARKHRLPIAHVNLVGGQDELVFDGHSLVADARGRIIAQAEAFKEDLLVLDLVLSPAAASKIKKAVAVAKEIPARPRPALPKRQNLVLEPVEEVYRALLLGLQDYVVKNGFKQVLIGLSGGIDSSVVAALAVDALGKENVSGVFMPSRYSSRESEEDARQLVQNLEIKFMSISIEQIYKMYLMVLEQYFAGLPRDIAEENLQARIRGNILMALSNKFGWLVLATGNKSEMSTGYATLYGDMAGGFALLKDVPKTMVYKLAQYRNRQGEVIPERVLTKAPTAELKPGQKDSDSLPLYDDLDPILRAYIEEDKDSGSICTLGFKSEVVSRVLAMVDRSEYKRRQAPPGIKITPKAFGKDRRMPITNKYKG